MEEQRQILECIAKEGHRISTAQLAQFRRAGVIHRPSIRSLGRPGGTVSEYPDGTARQLLRFLAAYPHRPRRKLREKAWKLWWQGGGDLVPAVRAQLELAAGDLERTSRWLGSRLDNESASGRSARAMEHIYKASQTMRLEGPLAAARRRVGKDRFSTVINLVSRIGSGRFTGFDEADVDEDGSPVSGSPAALLERALGLDRARVDRLADAEPWYSGSSQTDFMRLSQLFVANPARARILETSDESLEGARNELLRFTTTVSISSELMRRMFGAGAFGFGLFAHFLRPTRPSMQALLLLGWLALRQEADLRPGMEAIAGLHTRAEAWNRLYGILDGLRSEVPALAALLADRRLGRALANHASAARLAEEIETVRSDHEDEIRAFFARHPEVDELLITAQT